MTEQYINAPIDVVWDFFSSPNNLEKLTPNKMGFVQKQLHKDQKMYEGQMIAHIVKPILGIPINWVSEITVCKEQELFVDEQRVGPFALWHHEHHFSHHHGTTKVQDIVTYALPFGFLGSMAHLLFVNQKMNDIFSFRLNATEKLFNKQ